MQLTGHGLWKRHRIKMALNSRATIQILDALCEGPIEGFSEEGDWEQNIYLNETPMRDATGNETFADTEVQFMLGGQTQLSLIHI